MHAAAPDAQVRFSSKIIFIQNFIASTKVFLKIFI